VIIAEERERKGKKDIRKLFYCCFYYKIMQTYNMELHSKRHSTIRKVSPKRTQFFRERKRQKGRLRVEGRGEEEWARESACERACVRVCMGEFVSVWLCLRLRVCVYLCVHV